MTNRDKYIQVFGFEPDVSTCPAEACCNCPVHPCINNAQSIKLWWFSEYKGNDAVRIEVTEHHTFAKPDDVSDLDFPGVSSEDK